MASPVVTAGPDTSVLDIAQLMLDNKISAVPIANESGSLIGVVSEGDLMRRSEIGTERHPSWWLNAFRGAVSLAEEFTKSHGMKASEIMTKDVVTTREDASLWEIAETLERNKIKRLPVVRDGHVIGIVSRANLVQALMVQRDKAKISPTKDDRTIREELVRVLKDERWSGMVHLNIVVVDGTVHFWGLVNSETQRNALKVAAESLSGVSEVVDHTIIASTITAGK
jgi:CBS domain-containing protein